MGIYTMQARQRFVTLTMIVRGWQYLSVVAVRCRASG